MNGQVMIENNASTVLMDDHVYLYMLTYNNNVNETCFMFTNQLHIAAATVIAMCKDKRNKGCAICIYERINSQVGYQYKKVLTRTA